MNENTLTLAPLSLQDEAPMLEILTNEQIAKTYMLPDFTAKADAIPLFRRITELSRSDGRYVRGIYLKNTLIGFLNDVEIHGTVIELGYVIHPDYHNRGCATQALQLAIEELFGIGYTQVVAGAFDSNKASIRVMEKCCMKKMENTEEINYRGATHRCVYYSIGNPYETIRRSYDKIQMSCTGSR